MPVKVAAEQSLLDIIAVTSQLLGEDAVPFRELLKTLASDYNTQDRDVFWEVVTLTYEAVNQPEFDATFKAINTALHDSTQRRALHDLL